jgi:CHAT domain-containing protein
VIENFKLSNLSDLLVKYDENGNPIDGWLYKYYDFKEKRAKYYKSVSAYEDAWFNWKNATEDTQKRIYEELFQEIDKRLKNLGIRRFILIPHRGLHLLPLHAMFRENGDKREYLIDDYEISYGPSSHIVGLCQRKKGRRQESLLAVANPDRTLRFVDNEVKTISSQFDRTKILWYEQATKSAVVTYASKYDVLHFSCHGFFNPVEPMSSGLLLADEDQAVIKVDEVKTRKLTLAEIFKQISLPITSMVVLSACETGMTKLDISDEYVGLTSGFLYAGSPTVIGSLWEVDDLSTALLMGKFYENLRAGSMSKASALKEAQRWLRNLTAEGITKYFEDEIDGAVERILEEHGYKENTWRNWEKYEKLRLILRQREYPKTNERIFCHPYYWAAFFISGHGL